MNHFKKNRSESHQNGFEGRGKALQKLGAYIT